MNILVTGGAGYIGSICTETLLGSGHDVVVLDNLSTGHEAAVPEGASFVRGDISDSALVQHTVREHGVEAVLHFAAYSLVGESMREPTRYFENNTFGTFRLLKALQATGVNRFVLSSTAALFGTPERVPIAEDATVQPESVYGETKYLIERMLQWYRATTGLGFTTLRYFNAAGASEVLGEDHDPETHLIPLVLKVAAGQRENISVFGDDYPTPDGSCIRDYVDVRDLASAHLKAVEALEPGQGNAYNLGSGAGFSVFEVIDVCRQVTGHDIPVVVTERRPGDPAVLVADSGRITRELGWERDHTKLADTVNAAWAWMLKHPHGYDAD
mgnify:CR=1 FL=1